jgi:hypothetical protein
MDYFTKWLEVYAIPNQVADAPVTSFCCFRVLRELHSDQGRNFESWLMQEVLECLGICKIKPPLFTRSPMAW